MNNTNSHFNSQANKPIQTQQPTNNIYTQPQTQTFHTYTPPKKNIAKPIITILIIIGMIGAYIYYSNQAKKEVISEAMKQSFALSIENVISAAQLQYGYDSKGGPITEPGMYIYSIEYDLNLTSSSTKKGFVVVDATIPGNEKYIITMNDRIYFEIINYNTTTKGMPTKDTEEIKEYTKDRTIKEVCDAVGGICYNRQGKLIQ